MPVLGKLQIVGLTNETEVNPIKLVERLQGSPEMDFVEPDFIVPLGPSDNNHTAQDPTVSNSFREQWHLHGEAKSHERSELPSLNVLEAWKTTPGIKEIIVAVMDDGFDLSLADLRDNVVHPSDFTRNDVLTSNELRGLPDDNAPFAEASRGDYHGTACAGLAIGRGVDVISGVAPGCAWMPVRFGIGSTSQSLVLTILEYVSERADVLSCSWGLKASGYVKFSKTAETVVSEITTNGGRAKNGLVICFAAGNFNLPTYLEPEDNPDGMEYYGSGGTTLGQFFSTKTIRSGWTEQPGVIVVGSMTDQGRKALYSNWGPHLTVTAPSDNWHPKSLSTRPKYGNLALTTSDNENHGLGLSQVGMENEDFGAFTHGMGGTSGATPQVAGVCALILSILPGLSAQEVKRIIEKSCSIGVINQGLDEASMHNNAIIDGAFHAETGHSQWFGYGLLDAAQAVKMTKQRRDFLYA